MNKQQVQYITSIDQYIEKNNLRQLFLNLTTQLAKIQPEDPISYLIQSLENKNHLRIIFIHGVYRNDTVSLGTTLSAKFNYELIDMFDELKTEDINGIENGKINEKVVERMGGVSKNRKGVVVCGYPNNHIQAEFIQKKGLFPERLFVLGHDAQILEKYYINEGITPNKAKLLSVRNAMNTQEVKKIFEGLIDILPDNLDAAKLRGTNILSIKDKTPYPLDSIRGIVIHPPYLQPSCVKQLCNQFGLYFISLQSSFLKFKSQKSTFRQYVRNFQEFKPQLELGIIRTQCTSLAAKKKGYILSGWPNKVSKLTFLKEHYLKPHFIFVFNGEKQNLEKLYVKTDANNHQIFPLKAKPGLEEFRKSINEYNEFLVQIRKDPRSQVFDMEMNKKEMIRAFEILIARPEVYK